MNIQTRDFCLSSASQVLCKNQKTQNNAQLEQKFLDLLQKYNSVKQASIQDYERLNHQAQKSKAHHQNILRKLQKKYEHILHEERIKTSKIKQKLQSEFQKQRQMFKQIISNKNASIQKLAQMVQDSEKEKSQIVEQNTNNLISMVRSQQNCLQTKKYSHTQLMKMYQYLLEENNCLKKQLMKVQMMTGEQKGNQKTKRNKNSSNIVYTDHSEIAVSKYAPPSIHANSSMLKKNKEKSKENEQSFLMDVSALASQNHSKPVSSYKPKEKNSPKKNKINSSYQTNDPSTIIQEKASKKKNAAKAPKAPVLQITKKLK